MKKTITLVLCFILVLVFPLESYAHINYSKLHNSYRIPICDDYDSLCIMSNSNLSLVNDFLENESISSNEYIDLAVNNFTNKGNINYISGTFCIVSGDKEKRFEFNNVPLYEEKTSCQQNIISGVYETKWISSSGILMPIIFNIEIQEFSSRATVNITIGVIESNIGILLFGEPFGEYDRYAPTPNNTFPAVASELDTRTRSTPSYAYKGLKTNSSIAGNTHTSETVIMVASKRDFRDDAAMGASGAWGYEMIRIFGRSANVRNAISGASSAYPYKATAKFVCNTNNFLQIYDTTPEASVTSMPTLFDLLTSIHPTIGASIVSVRLASNSVNNVNVALARTEGNTKNNSATVEMTIPSSTSSNANLPSSSSYASAKTNVSNGITCEVCYKSLANNNLTGNITASGKMAYKVYVGNAHHIITATTGFANYSHNIYYVGA